jgi:hypothetical protein
MTSGRRLHNLQAAYGAPLVGVVPGLGFPYSEGLRIRLEHCAGRWWCVFDPFTFVDVPRSEEASPEGEEEGDAAPSRLYGGDPAGDWRRERWAPKYNSAWANIINAWADLLSSPKDEEIRAFNITEAAGVDAAFGVSKVTAWSRPAHLHEYFERKR